MKTLERTIALLAFPVALGAVACGAASTRMANVSPGFERVAHIHQARCGSCHTRVEPGTRSREQLDLALARHHNRVHLTSDEWTQMALYLAPHETPHEAKEARDTGSGRALAEGHALR
ncbi:MAG TPA: hypothetical protein VGI39_02105 [Polyangiaceae bacterium]|jgi:hypothetical protein